MRSSVHGRTSRRSQACAVHSASSTATLIHLAQLSGSALTTPLVPATSSSYSRPPDVCSTSAFRYQMTRTTTIMAYGYACLASKQAILISKVVEERVASPRGKYKRQGNPSGEQTLDGGGEVNPGYAAGSCTKRNESCCRRCRCPCGTTGPGET